MLSPLLFSVYLDGLLKYLRRKGLGCHIGGIWYGACGYADDLLLMAPSRDVLQNMLKVCEDYANAHNLVFSTDPVRSSPKPSACIFVAGKENESSIRIPSYLRVKSYLGLKLQSTLVILCTRFVLWTRIANGREINI